MKLLKNILKTRKSTFKTTPVYPTIKSDPKKMIENCKHQLNNEITSKKIIKNIQSDFKTKQIPDFIYISMIDHFLENEKISEALKTLTNSYLQNVILDRPFFEEVIDKMIHSEILENDLELVYSFYFQSFRPSFPILCLLHDALAQKKIKKDTYKKSCHIFVEDYNKENTKDKIDIFDLENKISFLNKEEMSELANENNYTKEKTNEKVINLKLDNIKEKDKKDLFSIIEKYQYFEESEYDDSEDDK